MAIMPVGMIFSFRLSIKRHLRLEYPTHTLRSSSAPGITRRRSGPLKSSKQSETLWRARLLVPPSR